MLNILWLFLSLGKFPSWAVNRIAQIIAPKTVAKLVKAARAYPAWKAKNSPHIKPWIYPEQNTLAPLNLADVSLVPDVPIDTIDEEEGNVVPDSAPASVETASVTGGDSDDTIEESSIIPQSTQQHQSITIG